MMLQYFRKKGQQSSQLSREGGFYLMLMIGGIVVLLAIVGLGLDSANMYMSRMQFQKAADAATVSALNYRIRTGPNLASYEIPVQLAGTATRTYTTNLGQPLKRAGQDIMLANLMFNSPNIAEEIIAGRQTLSPLDSGYEESTGIVMDYWPAGNYNNYQETFKAVITREVPYLIMNAVPIGLLKGDRNVFNPTFTSVGSSTGRVKPINVALMLDFSNSMRCPIIPEGDETDPDSGYPCPCLEQPDKCITYTDFEKSKFYQLIGGVDAFLEHFVPGKDIVTLVPFNLSGVVINPDLSSLGGNHLDYSQHTILDVENTTDGQEHLLDEETVEFWKKLSESRKNSSGEAYTFYQQAASDQLEAYKLGDYTNPSDAFLTAFQYLSTIKPDEYNYYVMFSDGSPTAGRFLLPSVGPGVGNTNTYFSGATRDTIHFSNLSDAIQILCDDCTFPNITNVYFPERFVKSLKNDVNNVYYGIDYDNNVFSHGVPVPYRTYDLRSTAYTLSNNANLKGVGRKIQRNTNFKFYHSFLDEIGLLSSSALPGPPTSLVYSPVNSFQFALPQSKVAGNPHITAGFAGQNLTANRPAFMSVAYSNVLETNRGGSGVPPGILKRQDDFEEVWNNCRKGMPVIKLDPGKTPPIKDPSNKFTCERNYLMVQDASGNLPYPGIEENSRSFFEMYYDLAIAYSDFLRSHGGMVLTIGYGIDGEDKYNISSCNDADEGFVYQNVGDRNARKDLFMARLAGDFQQLSSYTPCDFPDRSGLFSPSAVQALPEFRRTRGVYVPVDPTDPASLSLRGAFDRIGSLIARISE